MNFTEIAKNRYSCRAYDVNRMVEEEKIKETGKNRAAQYGKTEEELNKNEEYMEYVHKNQMIEKTVEYLMEKAKIK